MKGLSIYKFNLECLGVEQQKSKEQECWANGGPSSSSFGQTLTL